VGGKFSIRHRVQTALKPTQPPIRWVSEALSLGKKRLGREADHSPPSSTDVKEWVELYLHSPNMPSWCGVELNAQGQLYIYLYFYPSTEGRKVPGALTTDFSKSCHKQRCNLVRLNPQTKQVTCQFCCVMWRFITSLTHSLTHSLNHRVFVKESCYKFRAFGEASITENSQSTFCTNHAVYESRWRSTCL
jgi:hypothetical protein